MESIAPDQLYDAVGGFWDQIRLLVRTTLVPWRLDQLLALIWLAGLAWLLARKLSPGFHEWLRARQGWQKWQLRAGLMINQRMALVLFTAMAWAVVFVMREITWPSRSQLIAVGASISTALLAVALLSRLIANPLLRRIARWAAWIWAVLYLLGLLDAVAAMLDSIALTVGEMRISALNIVSAVVLTVALVAVARLISRVVAQRLAKTNDLTPTMRVLTAKFLQILLFSVAILIGLNALGLNLTGLAVFSGAVGLGLGFGLQKVVSNLVSGVIILLDKSVKPGDVISIGDTFGWIDELGARYVSVVTREGKEYLIPNEDLVTNQVVNWSHTNNFVRLSITFGTSFRDDPHRVSKIAINAAMTVKRVLAHRTPVCWITAFGDSSIQYTLRFWISDAQGGLANVRGEVFLALWDAFRDEGISVPYPQREVRVLREPDHPPAGLLMTDD